MNSKELIYKLGEINTENYIWCIYIGIILLSWYSNSLEKDYFLTKNGKSKDEYRRIIILIFSIVIVVYLYFVKDSFEGIKNLKMSDSIKKKELTTLSFMGSLMIAISGFIFLYIAVLDDDIDVELAFNWLFLNNMV